MQLSVTEASENVDRGKKCVGGPVDSGQSVALCQSRVITETQKDCEVNEVFETHPCSSSGCIDEFLADLEEVDCENSYSTTPSLHSNDAVVSSQHGSDNAKETILVVDDKNGTGTDAGTELEVLLVSSKQAKTNIQGEPNSDAEPTKIEEGKKDCERPSNECPNIKNGLHVGHACGKQDCLSSLSKVSELSSYSKRNKLGREPHD